MIYLVFNVLNASKGLFMFMIQSIVVPHPIVVNDSNVCLAASAGCVRLISGLWLEITTKLNSEVLQGIPQLIRNPE